MCKPDCENCPLQGRTPVLSTGIPSNVKLAVVAEGPDSLSETKGEAFCGQASKFVKSSLRGVSLRWDEHVFGTYAIACRPDPDLPDLKPRQWVKALNCCKPRLFAELQQAKERGVTAIFSLGSKSLHVLSPQLVRKPNKLVSVAAWEGAPVASDERVDLPVFPSHHTAVALRNTALRPIFKHWCYRVHRLVQGTYPKWDWGPLVTEVGSEMEEALRGILSRGDPIGVDIENLGDPMTARVRCIGVADSQVAVSVPLEQHPPEEILDVLRAILAGPQLKMMHNSQHDRLGCEAAGYPVSGPFWDTLLAHATYAPQLPHDLGFVCASETYAPRWKSTFSEAKEARGEEKASALKKWETVSWDLLGPYNCKDCKGAGPELLPIQKARIKSTHNGQALFDEYQALNEIALKMRRKGILVDTDAFHEHERTLKASMGKSLRASYELLGYEHAYQLFPKNGKAKGMQHIFGANGQTEALKALFFKTLKVKPKEFSKETGKPTLNKIALEDIIADYQGTPIAELAQILLEYRKDGKLLSTYVYGLPVTEMSKVHPIFKCYGTLTGRFSCTGPNIQNQPKSMRNMYIAGEGNVIISADFSQLESRIRAVMAGDEAFLEWIREGKDVHEMNGIGLFGEAGYKKGMAAALRDKSVMEPRKIAKIFDHGIAYGATPETLWRQMVISNRDLALKTVVKLHKRYFKVHPWTERAQMEEIRKATERGYVEEYLSGRREVFHDGVIEPNKVLNFPIQGAGATIMNRALIAIEKELDWETTWVMSQVHDEINLIVPEDKIDWAEKLLRKHMEQDFELDGVSLPLKVDVDVHPLNWRDKV